MHSLLETGGAIAYPAGIKRRKLSDEVQDRLLAIIPGGDLEPGDFLPSERELMTDFEVGRRAIREAMQKPATHGACGNLPWRATQSRQAFDRSDGWSDVANDAACAFTL